MIHIPSQHTGQPLSNGGSPWLTTISMAPNSSELYVISRFQPIWIISLEQVPPLWTSVSKQIRDGDEAKTIAEPLQKHIDRFEHGPSVNISFVCISVKCVMKKNHTTRFDLIRQLVGHPTRIVIEPVPCDQVPGDNLITKPQGIQTGRYALVAIRGAKQPLPVWGEGPLAGADLIPPFFSRKQRKR